MVASGGDSYPTKELGIPLSGWSCAIEELHDASLQGVLGADDLQPVILDQLLEHLRAVSQVIHGGADVGPDSLGYQRLHIVPEVGRQQSLDRGSHAVHDRPEVAGLVCGRPLQLLEGGHNCAALRVAEDRAKLSRDVTMIMEKTEFDPACFTAEVRRAMSGRPVVG